MKSSVILAPPFLKNKDLKLNIANKDSRFTTNKENKEWRYQKWWIVEFMQAEFQIQYLASLWVLYGAQQAAVFSRLNLDLRI